MGLSVCAFLLAKYQTNWTGDRFEWNSEVLIGHTSTTDTLLESATFKMAAAEKWSWLHLSEFDSELKLGVVSESDTPGRVAPVAFHCRLSLHAETNRMLLVCYRLISQWNSLQQIISWGLSHCLISIIAGVVLHPIVVFPQRRGENERALISVW